MVDYDQFALTIDPIAAAVAHLMLVFSLELSCLHIGGVLALFKPFQLRLFRNDRWEAHSFTTQLLSIRVAGHTVYSFH